MGLPQHYAGGQGAGHCPIWQEFRSSAGIGLEEEVRVQSAQTQGEGCVSQVKRASNSFLLDVFYHYL
jgi:hypothetical protein